MGKRSSLITHHSSLESKYVEMTQRPVKLLVCKMAVPTIIAMVTTALYNVVDAAFIGRLSTEGTAAINTVGTDGDDSEKSVYDLQGRQMNGQFKKGIYIVDGQKIVR